jgi:hypothetical protein
MSRSSDPQYLSGVAADFEISTEAMRNCVSKLGDLLELIRVRVCC